MSWLSEIREQLNGEYPNPHCQWCSRYARLVTAAQIILMLSAAFGGIMLLYHVRHDVRTSCCVKLREVIEINEVKGGILLPPGLTGGAIDELEANPYNTTTTSIGYGLP